MGPARAKLIEDLSGILQGELRCDALTVAMYATDGSLYQVPPLGVVFPRHRGDVVALLRYAGEQKIPVVARGAGTGVAGESLGAGLVVDFSRHMREVEWVGDDTVRVQPGVVLNQLNRALRKRGRYFPPDPSGASVTTVGSMLALDAAGSHSVRVGSTRDHVQSIELVLSTGECFEAADERLDHSPAELSAAPAGTAIPAGLRPEEIPQHVKRQLVERLAWLLHYNAPLIARHQPPLLRNRCGYMLRGVLDQRLLRLARLLIGSEGTLGLFTAATLHTMPLPANRGVSMLLFGQMDGALRAVQAVSALQPSACDLLDRRLLSLAREADPRFNEMIPADAEAAMLVEQTGFSAGQMQERLRKVVECVKSLPDVTFASHEAHRPEDVDLLWSLPERVVPLLARLHGPERALPFVEDLAVPPEAMHEFLTRARAVLHKHKTTNSFYAHAAAGQIHIRPFIEFPTSETASRLEDLARDLYQAVYDVGGTISGEHGAGLSRSGFIRDQYGPLYDVFRQVKELFDPQGTLNPGKILTDDPHLIIRNIRPSPLKAVATVPLQLQWSPAELLQVADRCNGCGHCRTQEPDLRMCPLFRLDPSEEASPRAKANLIRELATGRLPPEEWTSSEFKRIADLCVNCKQCQLECPSNVNVPQMMVEAKAAYVSTHGLSGTDWVLSRAHSFGALGTALSSPINWALNNPVARWFLEKFVGIARHRKLPAFARRTFLQTVRPELLQRPVLQGQGQERPVVYFIDHYVNFHDPELGQAFLEILRHNHMWAHVPPHQVPSGMAMVSAGDLESARDVAETNLRELVELARDGCTIVCTEPAAALCLKHEYPLLLNHPDARLVASRVVEAGAFLKDLHRQERLRIDFQPLDLDVGYHTPCHLKAMQQGTPLLDLLGLIPELRVHRIEQGCSGMAGTYGLTRTNFRNSVRMGWGLISRMRSGDLAAGTTECSSCKLQMEQGTSTPTLHPLKLLALAYGLMPQLRSRLKHSHKELVVT